MSEDKLWTRDYILLIIASLGSAFLVSFFLNTLPLYAEQMSGKAAYAGLMTTVYSIAALATRPVVGVACEHVRKVRLVIIGLVVMTSVCFSYMAAGTLFALLLLRAVHGIGFGIKSTTSGVVAAEIIPKSRFAEGIGIYGLYLPVANAIGPALGLFIIGSGGTAGFRKLFVLAGIIGMISIIVMLNLKYGKEESRQPRRSQQEKTKLNEAERKALPKTICGFEFGVVYPSIVLVLMYFGYSAIASFLPSLGVSRGLEGIGLFYTIGAAALFLSRLIYSKLVKRFGYNLFMIMSLLLFAVALIVIAFAKSIVIMYIMSVLYGIAMGIVPMVVNTQVLERCSSKRSGTAMAAYTSSMDIGIGVGSIALGIIADATSYATIFVIAGVCSLLAAAVYCLTVVRDNNAYIEKINDINQQLNNIKEGRNESGQPTDN
jgi:predicted MFS family arabinose efflux permease